MREVLDVEPDLRSMLESDHVKDYLSVKRKNNIDSVVSITLYFKTCQ